MVYSERIAVLLTLSDAPEIGFLRAQKIRLKEREFL